MSRPVTEADWASAAPPRSVVRQAVLRFALWSIVALVVLAIGSVFMSERIARQDALQDARSRAAIVARGVAGMVDHSLRSGDVRSVARFGTEMAPRLRSGTLSHVKVWAEDGTVIWADEDALVGRRFPLEEEVRSLFGTTETRASLSDLRRAENAGERPEGQLLEVYVGSSDSDNEPLVFEAYLATSGMQNDQETILAGLLPLSIGGILLFQLAVLPLAVSLARRVERAQADRAKLLRHALLASDLERRRIAQDLHDGVIQDLAGLGYAMPVVAELLPRGPHASDAREAVEHVSSVLGRDVSALRAMLTDIYPPDLEGEGLVAAVEELAMRAEDEHIQVSVQVTPDFHAPLDATRLAYRVVREGLRNVVRHAQATAAQVHLLRRGEDIVVRVVDDGRGLSQSGAAAPGHLGLRLLEDTVRDLGGRLDLSPGASGGAILEAIFPAELVPT